MKNLKLSICAFVVMFLPIIAQATSVSPSDGYTTEELFEPINAHGLSFVSLNELREELEGLPPISVGFDIDDTVLFSSPAFKAGQEKFSPGELSYLKNQEFWDKVNCGWDKFSIIKQSTKDVIEMHQKRGDEIYFITARPPSNCNFLTKYLKSTLLINELHDIIFTGDINEKNPKAKFIKKHGISIYYGDSDGDIVSARIAGAEGIRIMRSPASLYKPLPKNGSLGERILANSHY
ncbi:acid phosphatase AphA [Vibrio hangzhouensis]|uniref:acid phosphatase AphA n=1 Tax=Vibrio hangzhouensis TaxID=462991 RepID=UPI001C945D33|nr:acid phosphatase AphA [Vibrio hangzhouensis]MBY6195978.1 acid phosphatase AphA [Vibrio hangzhouensis]